MASISYSVAELMKNPPIDADRTAIQSDTLALVTTLPIIIDDGINPVPVEAEDAAVVPGGTLLVAPILGAINQVTKAVITTSNSTRGGIRHGLQHTGTALETEIDTLLTQKTTNISLFTDRSIDQYQITNNTEEVIGVKLKIGTGVLVANPGGELTAEELVDKIIENNNFNKANGGQISNDVVSNVGPLKGFTP